MQKLIGFPSRAVSHRNDPSWEGGDGRFRIEERLPEIRSGGRWRAAAAETALRLLADEVLEWPSSGSRGGSETRRVADLRCRSYFPEVNIAGSSTVRFLLAGSGAVALSLSLAGEVRAGATRRLRTDEAAGPEFQVNTTTTGRQRSPRVATDAAGGFVVVWQSDQDGSLEGIFSQRYDSSGEQAGVEFQVNTHTPRRQMRPSIAMSATGAFIVVWQSGGQDGSSYGVFGQRYDSLGTPLGGEFQVNTHTSYGQYYPSVAMRASGEFVVVWESEYQDGSRSGIFGQRFDSEGVPAGAEFQVNTYTTDYQETASAAMDETGGFVVVWESSPGGSRAGQDGAGYGIFRSEIR